MKKKIISAVLILLAFLCAGAVVQSNIGLMTATYDGANTDKVRIDASTNALQIIDNAHHEVHSGNSFGCIGVNDLSINNILDLQLVTPNTTKWIHLIISYDTESETIFEFYENVDINTVGDAFVETNHNRNSATTAGLAIAGIINTSLANAEADCNTTNATLLGISISGAGKSSGSDVHDHEWILDQNQDYLVRFTATTAGYVDYHLSWYEHSDIHP